MMYLKMFVMIFFTQFIWAVPVSLAGSPIKVVATIGQITDAVQNVGGEFVKVEGLMGPGVDPHLYKASESDVRKLSEAQIIFYNGLHLEAKMADIFKKMSKNKRTVPVTEDIDPQLILSSDTFKDQHDPHVWFDVSLWIKTVERIRRELKDFDPVHGDYYDQRAKKYIEELKTLHAYLAQKSQELPKEQRLLVTAHDAFRYFGRAYSFEVLGLQGISTEAEAGAGDVKKLANIIAQRKIKAIFVESSVPERNIRAVQEAVRAQGWDVKIGGELFSDALGHQGKPEGTYQGMVRHNINTIVEALK